MMRSHRQVLLPKVPKQFIKNSSYILLRGGYVRSVCPAVTLLNGNVRALARGLLLPILICTLPAGKMFLRFINKPAQAYSKRKRSSVRGFEARARGFYTFICLLTRANFVIIICARRGMLSFGRRGFSPRARTRYARAGTLFYGGLTRSCA